MERWGVRLEGKRREKHLPGETEPLSLWKDTVWITIVSKHEGNTASSM